MPKHLNNADLMSAPDVNPHSGRRSMVASESASTPQSFDEEKQKNGEISHAGLWSNGYSHLSGGQDHRRMPKLDRTMSNVYADELYTPSFQITTAAPSSTPIITTPLSPHTDIFSQRLQAANSHHLQEHTQVPLTIPTRERSPFRQGSPLAPTGNGFGSQPSGGRFGTASRLREQQKAVNDAQALRQQMHRVSPEEAAPKTVSPKDVDLVYHESEDSKTPLFPPPERQSPTYPQPARAAHEATEDGPRSSQQSYGGMATSRRDRSSNHSTTPPGAQQRANFNFATPALPGRQIPQQYPFVPQAARPQSGMSHLSEEFPATLPSMESSSSDFAPGSPELKKPARASADTGTYTCTYHGCTLRFDTPMKLQRHKREGHRNSTVGGGVDEGGMTSAAARNSQAGPHKCERINPSTGKPCNTIFSRPYDLTRHEDTIHNARKQKVQCPLCTEEKTFSRNDALTRHLRVVHPEHVELNKRRRGHD
ncbi:hypothetical protein BJ875DRAFT_382234 [Amylocarpus encephaloides]|uniref:C2H2-type domain-containing protein n=1 Tax=Amylocarpus encephaloides TaxID=45428 RepID=A0A9P8C354_9HELO|nr:hypothetical protein BJ875DRAFT_382234 [Amylocarpus encephaloides]